jgi:DNA polymerase-4
MSACVEYVCPSPMSAEPSEAPASPQLLRVPMQEASRSWLGKRSLALAAGTREPAVPAIVHVHVESFYAAVEQAANPRLRGKAVLVVGGGGVVASASLEAQRRGVAVGMTAREARKVCPNSIVVPGEPPRYAASAERLRRILETYAGFVEMTAYGSYYLDFSGSALPISGFEERLRRMQAEVLGATGLSVSVGAGTSRLIAALAAREHRPVGLRIVTPGEERVFLGPFPIEKLRGIGRNHVSALRQSGVATIGELQLIPKPVLSAAFGAAVGQRIWELARGQEVSTAWLATLPQAFEVAGSSVPA